MYRHRGSQNTGAQGWAAGSDCEAAKEALERRAKENATFGRNDPGVIVNLNSKAKHVQLQFRADGLGRHAASNVWIAERGSLYSVRKFTRRDWTLLT